MLDLNALFELQKKNRWNVSQSSAQERKAKLKALKQEILNRRDDIKLALHNDLKKPYAESELTEIHTSLDEINFAVKHLKCWMKKKRVRTPITLIGSCSEIHYEAKGIVLILSPWNYPFSLMINPLVAAVAAGNCIIGRPSEKTPHTGAILKEIIEAVFKKEEVSIVLGEVDVAEKLLDLPFDHIFFTGSTNVGKKVMAAAVKNLATVTLELGGKSPVIIDHTADLADAAKKLAWGKYMNAGQTCVAPDYLFIPEEKKNEFVECFKKQIEKNYGHSEGVRANNPDFARLIDSGSFKRLSKKLEGEQSVLNDHSVSEQNYLPPTLVETNTKSALMKDEIFGPILPIITYKNIDEVIYHIQNGDKPLALYLFSKDKAFTRKILRSTTSGGAVVNNVVLHLSNPHLPFGGVGHSGQGNYHGYFGFKAFSHERAVLRQGKFSLIPLYFPPYSTHLSKFAFRLLRIFE
jgi:aldehyde dehydrogenase (NAD+)